MGDPHFSGGDGEITFCGAIEMAGWLHLRVDVIKDGVAKYDRFSSRRRSHQTTRTRPIFEGISVDEAGKQHFPTPHRLPHGLPERDRISEEVRVFRAQA